MTAEQAKEGFEISERIKSLEKDLKELSKSESVDYVMFRHYQSGAPEYSYEVRFTDKEIATILKEVTVSAIKREIRVLDKKLKDL